MNKKWNRHTKLRTNNSKNQEIILDYDLFLKEMNESDVDVKYLNKPVKKNSKKLIQKRKIISKTKNSKNSKIYDIDNFVIQNTAIKIHQRHEKLDIPIPIFHQIELNTLNSNDESEVIINIFIFRKISVIKYTTICIKYLN